MLMENFIMWRVELFDGLWQQMMLNKVNPFHGMQELITMMAFSIGSLIRRWLKVMSVLFSIMGVMFWFGMDWICMTTIITSTVICGCTTVGVLWFTPNAKSAVSAATARSLSESVQESYQSGMVVGLFNTCTSVNGRLAPRQGEGLHTPRTQP